MWALIQSGEKGRFGRFQGMSQNFSYTLTPERSKRLFGGGSDTDDKKRSKKNQDDDGIDTDIESNVDENLVKGQRKVRGEEQNAKAETDNDGYMKFSMPWSLTFGYGITMRENTSGRFNTKTNALSI